jgi:hypothetical protein
MVYTPRSMGTRLNWQAARTRDSNRDHAADADARERASQQRPQRDPNKPSFAIIYARYANPIKARGGKPLPPLKWIASLKEKSRK